MTRMVAYLAAVVLLLSTQACELSEITVAHPDDVIIAEVVLRAEETLQTAFLHRTATPGDGARVTDAEVSIRDEETGATTRFVLGADSLCLDPVPSAPNADVGSCYSAAVAQQTIRAGARYTLRVAIPDGRVLTGVTRVPGSFAFTRPPATSSNPAAPRSCVLNTGKVFDITWTRSEGASVYLTDARLRGIRRAVRDLGKNAPGDEPLDLLGLSVSAADTTIRFPSELGLFDRFDNSVFDILVVLQTGLPASVEAEVLVAAADRNYVNWVRGGNFNPSGTVRVSSIRGDGAGVFGAIVTRQLVINKFEGFRDEPPPTHPCQ